MGFADADASGRFSGYSGIWATTFCMEPATDSLYLADVDRDGAQDLVCHDRVSGAVEILRKPSAD